MRKLDMSAVQQGASPDRLTAAAALLHLMVMCHLDAQCRRVNGFSCFKLRKGQMLIYLTHSHALLYSLLI